MLDCASPVGHDDRVTRPSFRGFRGAYLRTKRTERGLTQEQLAVRVGVFPKLVGKWERGLVAPSPGTVVKIAQLLGQPSTAFTDVPIEQATMVDLRLWAGLTRAKASELSGVSERALFEYEHCTRTPSDSDAEALGEVYGRSAAVVQQVYAGARARAYPDLA